MKYDQSFHEPIPSFSVLFVSFLPHFVLVCTIKAAERRRREEGWNDLGLDQIDSNGRGMSSVPARVSSQQQD
jgi:hypothetical protein